MSTENNNYVDYSSVGLLEKEAIKGPTKDDESADVPETQH